MKANTVTLVALICCVGCSLGPVQAAMAEYPIAGVTPYQRPEGAPTIEVVNKDGEWYRRALTGIERPYPYSLKFLENQGNWHTPFNHPGMPGRYDIRGWYRN